MVRGAAPRTRSDGRTTEAIGLETIGGVFTALLPAGCTVPCSTTETFTTAADQQTQLSVTLYRGNANLVSQATLVGEFRIDGCVSGPRGVPRIMLTVSTRGRDLLLTSEEARSKTACQITRVRGG